MNKIVAAFMITCASIGGFCLLFFTPLGNGPADLLSDKMELSYTEALVTASFLCAVITAFITAVIINALSGKNSSAAAGTGSGSRLKTKKPEQETINVTIINAIKKLQQKLQKRDKTIDIASAPTAKKDMNDYQAIFDYRQENALFLTEILRTLEPEYKQKSKEYKSGEHPELVVEEVRELIQTTLYKHCFLFYKKVDSNTLEKDPDWPYFQKTMKTIENCIDSINLCYDFYLYICRDEKDMFIKFNDYGVLPLEVGYRDGPELNKMIESKALGEDFEYNLIVSFREHTDTVGIRLNPSIPEAFYFFDRCVLRIADILNICAKKAPSFLKVLQLTKSEAYTRLTWIRDNLNKIKPESTEYYIDSCNRAWEDYQEKKQKIGLLNLPDNVLQEEDKKTIISGLQDLIGQGSRIIYKTKKPDKKDG